MNTQIVFYEVQPSQRVVISDEEIHAIHCELYAKQITRPIYVKQIARKIVSARQVETKFITTREDANSITVDFVALIVNLIVIIILTGVFI